MWFAYEMIFWDCSLLIIVINIITMKESRSKKKKHQGHSEFIRSKLEEEYSPKLIIFRENTMPFFETPKSRHENIAREED